MTDHDVLYGYRLALFDLAARTTVSHACRTFGVHRSTYYVWKRQVNRHGLGMLRPRERRRPRMPNQLSALVEQRIVAFALGHPGLGPRRVAAELARPKWGGIVVSANGVWRVLRRHGLNTRARRLGLVAGYAAPYQPPRQPAPEPHIEVTRPGELVGMDCFYVGRLRRTRDPVWQLTAIDCYSSYAWAELVTCPHNQPSATYTSRLARRVQPISAGLAGNSSAYSPTTATSTGHTPSPPPPPNSAHQRPPRTSCGFPAVRLDQLLAARPPGRRSS
jgi:transposase